MLKDVTGCRQQGAQQSPHIRVERPFPVPRRSGLRLLGETLCLMVDCARVQQAISVVEGGGARRLSLSFHHQPGSLRRDPAMVDVPSVLRGNDARVAGRNRDWRLVLKLIEDKLIAASALLLLLPLYALISLAIKLDSPGPVFFCQRRIGFNNKVIEVYKFRTMFHAHQDRDGESLTVKSDPRVTSVGRFLRRTSADELPQLLNVLTGSMSIVGPRPHAIRARVGGKLYGEAVPRYAERHKVKPGITGWAQVNGWRGETTTEDELRRRIECDIYYLENWSVFFDLRIMLRTIIAVIAGKGAY